MFPVPDGLLEYDSQKWPTVDRSALLDGAARPLPAPSACLSASTEDRKGL